MSFYAKQVTFIVILIVALLAYRSFYTVIQGEQAVVLRLGKVVTNNNGQILVKNPGLHIKIPLIENVRWFDMRLQTLSVDSSRILTQEQKYVIVDYYAKWR
jgi:modulator of FtsH protease HflC